MKSFVAYYRVSTQKQGASGLGMDAQRRAVQSHAKDGEIIAEFSDVESGKVNTRDGLRRAIETAKKASAVLLIAKLDRLARNVAFIANLMESGVDFVACDMPTANKFTVHIFAALAEQEREMISKRTREALQSAKERGVKLGKPENLTDQARAKGIQRHVENARMNGNNRKARAMAEQLRAKGRTLREIAADLNRLGFAASRGGQFSASQVMRLLEAQ